MGVNSSAVIGFAFGLSNAAHHNGTFSRRCAHQSITKVREVDGKCLHESLVQSARLKQPVAVVLRSIISYFLVLLSPTCNVQCIGSLIRKQN